MERFRFLSGIVFVFAALAVGTGCSAESDEPSEPDQTGEEATESTSDELKSVGERCTRNRQCRSYRCGNKRHVCLRDNDPGGTVIID